MAYFNESPEQGQETRIPDPLPYTAHQQFVMHRVKVAGEITFDHPAPRRSVTVLKLNLHGADGVMHAALWPETIGEAMKIAFPDRLHGHEHGTLYDPIPKGRNTQWPRSIRVAEAAKVIEIRSRRVGIPSGRCLPLAFGI